MNKDYFLILCFFSIVFSNCYYDNKEDLFQIGDDCELEGITYFLDVKPIFEDQCYNCHATVAQLGNVNLEDFQSLKSYVNNESLLKSIKHEPGVSAMPQDGAKISDCKIQKIERWIIDGALEN